MSNDLVAVTNNIVTTVLSPISTIVSLVQEHLTPVVTSGSQGPVGGQGIQGIQGIQGTSNINQATDVDVTNIKEGSLLIYNQPNAKWVASNTLENQALECGQY